jgi:methyl-accepting chemotaxis protein WspA
LLSVLALLAAIGFTAWLASSYSAHLSKSHKLENLRDQVQLSGQQLANTVNARLLWASNDAGEEHLRTAEARVRQKLAEVLVLASGAPALVAATEVLRDSMLGSMHDHYIQLMREGPTDIATPTGTAITRHIELQKTWDDLFTKFSTQINFAVQEHRDTAGNILLSGLIVVPLLIIAGLVGAVSSGTGRNPRAREIVWAIKRMRSGEFDARLGWDRDGDLGDIAGELDQLCIKLSSLTSHLKHLTSGADSAASRVSATAREQGQKAVVVATELSMLDSTFSRMASEADRLRGNSEQFKQLLGETFKSADEVNSVSMECQASLKTLSTSTDGVSDKLSLILEKTEAVIPHVTMISKVADQANLLSLNAAIEAEKAGEYGLGFAVVAMEVRRFAEQTISTANALEQLSKDLKAVLGSASEHARKNGDETRAASRTAQELSMKTAQVATQLHGLGALTGDTVRNVQSHAVELRSAAIAVTELARALKAHASNENILAVLQDLETSVKTLNSSLREWDSSR